MNHRTRSQEAFVFDLDGTLVDSVYQHVMAWREALGAEGIELSMWRIHRKVGMSGGLMTDMLLREAGRELDRAKADRLRRRTMTPTARGWPRSDRCRAHTGYCRHSASGAFRPRRPFAV